MSITGISGIPRKRERVGANYDGVSYCHAYLLPYNMLSNTI
jgi:hypothetical protein